MVEVAAVELPVPELVVVAVELTEQRAFEVAVEMTVPLEVSLEVDVTVRSRLKGRGWWPGWPRPYAVHRSG